MHFAEPLLLNASLYRFISKLVHTLIGPIICTLQKCIYQNNVTYISMAIKYPIIKHRAFFETFTFFISTNNEDIGHTFLPDTDDHTLMLYKINDLKRAKFKVTPRIHCFARCCYISLTEPHKFVTSWDTLSDKN